MQQAITMPSIEALISVQKLLYPRIFFLTDNNPFLILNHLVVSPPNRFNMTSIGSLVFCADCGSLLDENENREDAMLKCDVCGAQCKDTSQKVIITESKPTAYPSSLRAKRSEVQQITDESRPERATITQKCDECGRTEVQFYEQQLRSADEGTTIFYVCDCGNKYVQCNAFSFWDENYC
jgi:DNA-directed RNA polymerase I subunit RPA12